MKTLNLIAIAVLVLGLSSGVVVVPVARVLGRRRPTAVNPRPARVARWIMLGLGAATLLLLLGLAVTVVRMDDLVAGNTTLLAAVLVLPVLILAGSIACAALALIAWKEHYWGIVGRVHVSLMALSGLTLAWFFNYWNLLGWQY